MTQSLLEVSDLTVRFHSHGKIVDAVKNVSWGLDRGETLVILGESGSGKSVSASAVMGLIDIPPGEIVSGQITRWRPPAGIVTVWLRSPCSVKPLPSIETSTGMS